MWRLRHAGTGVTRVVNTSRAWHNIDKVCGWEKRGGGAGQECVKAPKTVHAGLCPPMPRGACTTSGYFQQAPLMVLLPLYH